jgi:hypothetical protein
MLVRDCYRELANLYFHKIGSQWKNSILTGSPGTGKSLSVLYFLTEAVKIPSIEVIVLEFRKFGKLAFERHKHGWKPFKAALNPLFMPNNYIGLYITDPGIRRELAEHHEGFHNLLIHSPTDFQEVKFLVNKCCYDVFISPPCSEVEVQSMNENCFDNQKTKEEIHTRFEICGGNARWILQNTPFTKFMEQIHDHINKCNVKNSLQSIAKDTLFVHDSDGITNNLIHVFPENL